VDESIGCIESRSRDKIDLDLDLPILRSSILRPPLDPIRFDR
jgi:hypothetical protein